MTTSIMHLGNMLLLIAISLQVTPSIHPETSSLEALIITATLLYLTSILAAVHDHYAQNTQEVVT